MGRAASTSFLDQLAPGAFDFGRIVLVEFQAHSLWYEAALTITAQGLRSGARGDFHTFQHPPDDARRALRRQGIDAKAAEAGGKLRIIDSYSVQTGLRPTIGQAPYGFTAQSLKMSDWIRASPRVLNEREERRLVHIDENDSVLLSHNSEAAVLEFFRTRAYEGARRNEILFIHSFLANQHSRRFYAAIESLADIIVDFEGREEAGRLAQRVRVRQIRGGAADTRWRALGVTREGEVVFGRTRAAGRSPSTAPSPPERRLAAIMFTDMVGYTRLTQESERASMEMLAEHNALLRQVFRKFHGTEIKTMGDAFLVEFPSALAATECALGIQQALDRRNAPRSRGRIRVRIGVHVGDVIHRAGDVYGDAVNIASRIESLAPPGGVCVTQQVYDQVWNKLNCSFRELGARELKGIRLPLAIYRIDAR